MQELKVRAMRLAFDTWDDENLAERFESEPNKGLKGRRVDILAGKTLGGSSSINVAQWTIPSYEVSFTFNRHLHCFALFVTELSSSSLGHQ